MERQHGCHCPILKKSYQSVPIGAIEISKKEYTFPFVMVGVLNVSQKFMCWRMGLHAPVFRGKTFGR
jgi:hypothetical protein